MRFLALVLAVALLAPPSPPPPGVAAVPTLATLAVGGSPTAVALDPGTHTVYVAAERAGVAVIDGTSLGVVERPDAGGSALAVDPATHAVYAAYAGGGGGGVLAIWDAGLEKRLASFPIAASATAFGLAIDPRTPTAFLTGNVAPFGGFLQAATLVGGPAGALDARTLWISDSGDAALPTFDPVRRVLYVVSNYKYEDDSFIAVLDADALLPGHAVGRSFLQFPAIPDLAGFLTGLGVDPGTGRLFVTTSIGRLVDIDRSVRPPRSRAVRIGTLGPLHGGLAVDPAGQVVYVVNAAERAVYAVDERTDAVTAKGAVGADPDAVAVDPGTHRVYIANRGDGTVTVLRGIDRTVAPALPGLPGAGGGGMAADRLLPGALLLGLAALATAALGRRRTGAPSRGCREGRSEIRGPCRRRSMTPAPTAPASRPGRPCPRHRFGAWHWAAGHRRRRRRAPGKTLARRRPR